MLGRELVNLFVGCQPIMPIVCLANGVYALVIHFLYLSDRIIILVKDICTVECTNDKIPVDFLYTSNVVTSQ